MIILHSSPSPRLAILIVLVVVGFVLGSTFSCISVVAVPRAGVV